MKRAIKFERTGPYCGQVEPQGDMRGVAEEAPGAYKDVNRVVEAAHEAGLSRRVARMVPLIVVKG
jgi:RNA-splicing ligase RtcB